jgi:CBS domain-containing protein
MMSDIDSGVLPVGENDRLVGMITDRDIAVRGVAEGRGPECRVRDLMSEGIICARDDEDVAEVAQRMSDKQVRRLPVLDANDRIVGIVSLGDLSRETGGEAAHFALDGVSESGGQHQQ